MSYQPLDPTPSTSSSKSSITSSQLRKWRPFVLLAATALLLIALIPTGSYTPLTTAAHDLIHLEKFSRNEGNPTIAVAEMQALTSLMAKAGRACGWSHGQPHREHTTSPYGWALETPPDSPYFLTESDQYSLDHILTTRVLSYANRVPLLSTNPPPDFIFLPVLSQLWSNPWGCPDPNLLYAIERTTQLLREITAQIGPSPYPRIILPIATIRSNLERSVFTPELMEELKDSVIVVSIENALKTNEEGMNYTIDLPYPTAFHLSLDRNDSRSTLSDELLTRDRPYLLNYAASTTHPWGASALERFNGFALRAALHREFVSYNTRPGQKPSDSRILYDEITNAMDGAQNLTMFHEHMAESVFCPMPAGDSPSRRAFYEALLLGCIPVVFRQHSYGRLFPSSPDINDISKYTVFIDENDLILERGPSLISRLESISPSQIRKMQQHIHRISPRLQWSLPTEQEWFASDPWTDKEDQAKIPEAAKLFNLTETREKERVTPPTEDAFTTFLKELRYIRDGRWKKGYAVDLRPDPLEELGEA